MVRMSLFQYVVVTLLALAAIVGRCGGRDLRPSDHGLVYQEASSPPPPAGDEQEMLSFFGQTTSSSSVELPEAKNISDTWWGAARAGGNARDVEGRDHVRVGLLVASGVCGLTGVVLLVVSAVVFIFRLRKEKIKDNEVSSTSAPVSVTHSQTKAVLNQK